jgi:tetratricopeptide (TPR) repeat protein
MRQLILSIFLLTGFLMSHAQEVTTPTLNYDALERKLEKSDKQIKDEKKSQKAKTWFKRGELFQDINDVNTEFVRLGMGTNETELLMGQPNEIRTNEEEGTSKEVYVYDRVNLIFENGALFDYEETEVIHPNPLPEALAAYKKVLELDDKEKYDNRLKDNLERLKRQFEEKAVMGFNQKNYDKSLEAFENILEIGETRLFEAQADTVIYYNAALAARNAGNHEKAIEFFKKAIDLGYGGSDAYYLLKTEYIAVNDSNAALKALEEGYEKYPDTTLLLIELVNYCLTSGDTEQGLRYLELAQQKEANNPDIYFAQGTLFEKIGDKEKAMEMYNKAIEINPEYFNAYFNKGALYYNNAVEMYEEANKIEELEAYNKAKAVADEELRKAIAPLEKAREIKPDERATLETLQTIYYRLQMTDKYEEVKKKLLEMEE